MSFRSSLNILAALLLLLSGAASVGATEDDMVVEGPITPNAPQQGLMVQMGMQNIDQILFQPDGSAAEAKKRLEARTELKLTELDQVCQLNEAQKRKLELAARGDLKRFLIHADGLRLKFEKLIKAQKVNDGNAFNEAYMQMWQEIQPLQVRMSSGLSETSDSLFMKVLSQTLSSEQQEKYAAVTTDRQRFRFEANIAVCLNDLEDVVFLSESQREAITKLMLALPPLRQTGQYEMQAVWCRLGMIPTEQLEPIFKPDQWRKFKPRLEQYRNTRRGYIQSGYLDPEDFPEPAAEKKP